MARIRRVVSPGALIHIIVRFVNHEFLLDSVDERNEYLRRAGIAFQRTDWIALSYALMSTHTHFAALAGENPFADWSRPLHSGFVVWLNPRRARLGAAIANRPATYEVAPTSCGRLIAYHHNNPVRAGVVDTAAESDWTSHRAYSSGNSPDWLRDDIGLELAGFDNTRDGRIAFADAVDSSKNDEWLFGDEQLMNARRDARAQLGSAIEVGQPILGERTQIPLFSPSAAALRPTWNGSLETIAKATSSRHRMSHSTLVSRSRLRDVVVARRVFLLVAVAAGRTVTEAAAYVGISVQAASKSIGRADADLQRKALSIAAALGIIVDLG